MEERCPGAVPYAVGTLEGWELIYRGLEPEKSMQPSRKRRCCHPGRTVGYYSGNEKALTSTKCTRPFTTKRMFRLRFRTDRQSQPWSISWPKKQNRAARQTPTSRQSGKAMETLDWICLSLKHPWNMAAVKIRPRCKPSNAAS